MRRQSWSATLVAGRMRRIAAGAVLRPALSTLLLVCALPACGDRGKGPVDDTAATTVPGAGTIATAGAPSDTAAPQGATWNLEMVEGQLREAGFTVSRDRTPVNLPFMSVPGTALDLGGGVTVQVYLYGDAAARGLDTDKLDASRAAPRGGPAPWRTAATLVTDNNLAAIILTADPGFRARIGDALHRRGEGDGALR